MSGFRTRSQVEDEATEVLRLYRKATSRPIEPPVEVDLIGEILFDLRWGYEMIDDPETLAALYSSQKTVELNEAYVEKFDDKPGLERFTKGHETGHWVLHVENPGGETPFLDHGTHEEVFCRNDEKNRIERQADWFAGGLLMPEELIVSAVRDYRHLDWRELYEIREEFGVTISALKVRMEQLGLIHVTEDGDVYRNREEASGQQLLF